MLIDWFYCISTSDRLSYAEVRLTIMVSKYKRYKNYLHNHFKKVNILLLYTDLFDLYLTN